MSLERGNGFEAPAWWLRLARPKLANQGGYKNLSAEMASLVGRRRPWHHSTLSRFVTDPATKPTQDFAIALSLYFEIPAPVYIPRTLVEARAMQAARDLASITRATHRRTI